MTNYERALSYIRETVRTLPTQTASHFNVSRTAFRDIDQAGGARVDLELMVGHSRVFELNFEDSATEVIKMGQPVPSSYQHTLPIRVRYEGNQPHRVTPTRVQAKQDQMILIDALMRNSWHSVTGLVHLNADPGDIDEFNLTDDTGNELVGYIGETVVTFSHDI